LCNLTCTHCHVNAGPGRKELMSWEDLDRTLDWLESTSIRTVDLTGGAPEMNPNFRRALKRLKSLGAHVMDRCNLTILLEPGYEDMVELLAESQVEIVASMPCYAPENVNEQRGDGVFDASIKALQLLNRAGYGIRPELKLNLVYNPNGAKLPPDQQDLEADYKSAMLESFGIQFHQLYTITNLPISRFLSWLKRSNQLESYMETLVQAFNPSAVQGLMCRNTISVDWQGAVYDCDFNQQLDLAFMESNEKVRIWELDLEDWRLKEIQVGAHCFGCTAGAGSSCGGALVG
jgi:radical SAM/Cys-rich protein